MVNPERGEVKLTVRDETVTLAPEMARFAVVSHEIGTQSLQDLLTRIQGAEPHAMYACISAFTIAGDARAMRQAVVTFEDLATVSKAMLEVVSSLIGEPSKNGQGEAEKG